MRGRNYTPRMDRRAAYVLLAVFGAGVFLAGLELMVTAVALPSILGNLAGTTSATAWIELRKASWIINGYLLVYILVMPLAGRLADLWGTRRLFMAALAIFVAGSALAGSAQNLDQLIAARVVQAIGGGVLVPVGTAAASHLFDGAARPRALGVIGALTFLGMAAGPAVGAAILGSVHADTALTSLGAGPNDALSSLVSSPWRWVFYLNVPIGLVALLLAWAASATWETPHHPGRIDVLGAALFGIALVTGLVGLTLVGTRQIAGSDLDPGLVTVGLLALAAVATVVAVVRGLRVDDPFLDPHLFQSVPFSSAALVSLLTGYGFATAIIGGAVFVDRVLYGGPDDQRLALGALAGATALGALASGFVVRLVSLRLVTLAGLALSVAGFAAMATWRSGTPIESVALALGRGRGGGRPAGVRRGIGCRHGGPDDRHGGRAGDPDRVRLDHHRPPRRPDLCHAHVVSRVHSRGPARPPAQGPVRRRRPRGLGVTRSRRDHGRPLPRRRHRHRCRRPAGDGPRRPSRTAHAHAAERPASRGRTRSRWRRHC